MAFDRAKTNLSAVEEKLRKFFGLAGEIGASFAPSITPVQIVGDLRDPGVAAFRGRRFAWAGDLTAVLASGVTGLKFGAAAIVERVRVTNLTAGQRIEGYYFSTGLESSAPAVALATPCGVWVDQGELATDFCPLFTCAGPSIAGSAVNFTDDRRFAVWGAAAGDGAQWDYGMHMPAGSALYFNVAGVQAQVQISGRIFG